MNALPVAALTLALLAFPAGLRADTLSSFSYTVTPLNIAGQYTSLPLSQPFTVSGTITTVPDPDVNPVYLPGVLDLTSLSINPIGSYTGSYLGDPPTATYFHHGYMSFQGSQSGFEYDDTLYPTDTPEEPNELLDNFGIFTYLYSGNSLSLAHIYGLGVLGSTSHPVPTYEADIQTPNQGIFSEVFTVTPNGPTPSAVPEPGSFALLATGLLGGVAALRRRCLSHAGLSED